MSDKRLKFMQLVAYAAPSGALGLATVPITAVLPTLYAKYAAVTLTSVGIVFTLRTLFDAVSDQVIGFLSDRTRTPIGARKPWLIAGSLLVAVSVWFLFRIPPDAGIVYFGAWTILFYIGYTMFNIPHLAWGNELSGDYQERARIFGFKGVSDTAGSMLIFLLPMALAYTGITATEEFTPGVIYILGLFVIVALPALTGAAVAFTPHGSNVKEERTTIRGLLSSVRGNRPFLRFLTAYMVAGAGTGFFAALVFPFMSEHLGIGSSFPLILLLTNISGLVAIPIWVRLVKRFSKHRCWAVGWITNSLVFFPLAFVEPGPGAVVPTIVCMIAYGLTNGVSVVAPFSILADVVDYDHMRTGVDRAGNYFALAMLVVKMLASTGGIALMLLGSLFGYDLSEGAVNTPFATAGLVWMFILAPAGFQLLSVPFVWNFPIDQRRQEIIRRRIDQRLERAERTKALPEGA